MKRIFFLLTLLSFIGRPSQAQRETENWNFGDGGTLEFSPSGNVTSTLSSAMTNSPEGCATISDKNGQLLFYSNGEAIWDRTNSIMMNGDNLLGNHLSTQSSLIVPHPGNDSLYYLFTTDAIENSLTNGLRYNLIDMRLNWPLGAVVAGQKNLPLYGSSTKPVSEKLTAVRHANNQDIWVIVQSYISLTQQEIIAFRITATGLTTTPVISVLPAVNGGASTKAGYLKASPQGNYLAGNYGTSGCYLFDFYNNTGLVSNARLLSGPLSTPFYGLEFSPDGTKLYTATSQAIEQFNLAAGSQAAVLSSRVILNPYSNYGALQLGTNGKIYIARPGNTSLAEIRDPNAAGMASDLQLFGIRLAFPTASRHGLPNFMSNYFAPPRFHFTGNCAGEQVSFTIPNTTNLDSVNWNFGDTTPSGKTQSRQLQPVYTFTQPGTFTVRLTTFSQGQAAVYERQVTVLNKPIVRLPADLVLCQGDSVRLRNDSSIPRSPYNERYLWSTGDTSYSIQIGAPGIYWLEMNNGFCTTRDSLVVKYNPRPKVNLGDNKVICGPINETLDAGNPGSTYLWSPGKETTQTIQATKNTVYTVRVTSPGGCTAFDTLRISSVVVSPLELGPDIVVCEGEPVLLKAAEPGGSRSFIWSDGSRLSTLKPTKSGKYWVRFTQTTCTASDTVNVTFIPCPPPPIPVIPNIITPNGDNVNDKLVIKEIPEGLWHLKIFNRWGLQLLDQERYHNDWPQNKVTDGTYYYLLEDPDTKRQFKGWLEVVR